MSKPKLIVNGPRGRVVNQDDADKNEMKQAVELLAEKLAPMVAKLLEGKAPTINNGSNGRKIRANDLTSHYSLPPGDEFDTLPDGDYSPARGGVDQYELPD